MSKFWSYIENLFIKKKQIFTIEETFNLNRVTFKRQSRLHSFKCSSQATTHYLKKKQI